jgi:hypothetical protein
MKNEPLAHGVHTVEDALQWARWSRTMTGMVADHYQFRQAVIAARLLQEEIDKRDHERAER